MPRLPRWKRLIQPLALLPTILCLATGACAGAGIWVQSQKSPIRPDECLKILISVVIACLMAIFGAAFIAVAHIPSGH